MRIATPQEAKELMDGEGYVYLDVRSVPEFEEGHPEGAYNVPLLHAGPMGMAPNADFLEVVQAAFPEKEARLVIGCRANGRSLSAASLLQGAGYANVVVQSAGFEGAPDPRTGRVEPGWRPAGLPVAAGSPPGRHYEDVRSRKP